LLVDEPTADTVVVRHPTGRKVEICTVAGSKAGASLVARWSAGCIFDEAPRMCGAGEAAVNYDDLHDAVIGRLRPGAQVVSIGSPWAPQGPMFEAVRHNWLRPTQKKVVIKAPAYALNPIFWTAEKCAKVREEEPDVYRTDVEAEFASTGDQMFSATDIEAAIRHEPVSRPYEYGIDYRAFMDPATRSNDWTLAIAAMLRGGVKSIVYARRWQGSKTIPLRPKVVMREVAEICGAYGLDWLEGDQWSGDALADIAQDCGLHYRIVNRTSAENYEVYRKFGVELAGGGIELHPDPYVRSDLVSVEKRVTPNGIRINLPRTNDGRHADYAPAVVGALADYLDDPVEVVPRRGTPEFWRWEMDRMEQQEMEAFERRQNTPWWDRVPGA